MRNFIRNLTILKVHILRKLFSIWCLLNIKLVLFLYNIPHGKVMTGGGLTKIIMGRKSRLILGDNINFANYWEVGWNSYCYIRIKNEGKVKIGNNVGINSSGIFCDNSITIGDNVHIGGGCQIFDTNFHNMNYIERRDPDLNNISLTAPVVIEEDVFIGSSCIVGKGVTIGARSIVAAGSVVIKSIPSDELWGGNPAKFIKKI